ncbi:MAG: glycosyltransferase family 2 protein [Hyphomicrobiaceae bacterium]
MTSAVVAVITHSRPKGLERLLVALSKQKVGKPHDVQVLVVDNACDPEIRTLVDGIGQTCPFQLTYSEEARRGIVAARNRCVDIFLQTDAECLLFIDDDSWPVGDDWIQSMIDARSEFNADIVAGGVRSLSGAGAPGWANHIIHDFGGRADGTIVRAFYTSNLLISRTVLERVSPAFDSRFDMTGGSDYHFSVKCSKAGFKAVYADAQVEEEFPRSRANVRWFLLRGYRSGIADTRAHIIEDGLAVALTRSAFMASVRFARGVSFLGFGLLTVSKARLVNGLFRIASSAGTVAGYFGATHREYDVIHGS